MPVSSVRLETANREEPRMRLNVSFVLFFGACACCANTPDDAIKVNEIDDNSSSRERYARNITLAEIFENAVQAYLDEEWDDCIVGFNDALHGYESYRR